MSFKDCSGRRKKLNRNSRCPMKRAGMSCDCGVWGKKPIRIPFFLRGDSVFVGRARKWLDRYWRVRGRVLALKFGFVESGGVCLG